MGKDARPSNEIRLSRAVVILALSSFLLLLAYVPTVDAPFIFDDENDIVGNTVLATFWPPEWIFLSRRPFATFTFALNFALFGESPLAFRVVNIAIHLASFFLANSLLRLLARAPKAPTSLESLAPVVAGLWALHPLHTSAVTYVVHRYESLAGALYLLTLFSFFRARETNSLPRTLAFVGFGALASVTKEIAVTLPLVALLLERGFYGGTFTSILRGRLRDYALLGVSLLPLVVFLFLIPQAASQRLDNALFSPTNYALSEPSALAHYVRLALWPTPLSIDYYDWPVVEGFGNFSLATLGTVAIIVVFVVSGLFGRFWALPILLALVYLAPTSSVIPLRYEIVAERRMYLPLLPLVALLVFSLHRISAKLRSPTLRNTLLGTLAFLVAASLTGVTLARNTDYLDPIELYEHEIEARPKNARSHAWLGQYLAKSGELERAYEELRVADRLDTRVPLLERQLAFVAHELGKHEEAAKYARLSLDRHPDEAESFYALVLTLPSVGGASELVDRLAARAKTTDLEIFLLDPFIYYLATDPARRDGILALSLSDRLLASGGPSPRALELRALALGALGRFDEALRILGGLGGANPRFAKERDAFVAKRPFDYREAL